MLKFFKKLFKKNKIHNYDILFNADARNYDKRAKFLCSNITINDILNIC